jgi:hypothetical protein
MVRDGQRPANNVPRENTVKDEQHESAQLTSMSGSPIYRHGAPAAWEPPRGEEFIEEISAHVERHLGPVASVFHEIASDTVHVDVHSVKPTRDVPFVRLVTSGMSDLPMETPQSPDIPRFVELLMTLPADWRLDPASFDDERWYWPIRLLKSLARLPHKHRTWLGWGHTVPNGDPPEPYASDTKLCAAMLMPPVTVPEPFHELEISGRKRITFYAVVPLYEAEMNLKLRLGSGELAARFDKHGVTDLVCTTRKDVARKRFGLW